MPNAIASGDVDGDGMVELVVGSMCGHLFIYKDFQTSTPWVQTVGGLGTIMAVAVGTFAIQDVVLDMVLNRHCVLAASAEGYLYMFDIPWSVNSHGETSGFADASQNTHLNIEPVATCSIPCNAVAIALETMEHSKTRVFVGSDEGLLKSFSIMPNDNYSSTARSPLRSRSPAMSNSSNGDARPESPSSISDPPCYVGKLEPTSFTWDLQSAITSFCQVRQNPLSLLKTKDNDGAPSSILIVGLKEGGFVTVDTTVPHCDMNLDTEKDHLVESSSLSDGIFRYPWCSPTDKYDNHATKSYFIRNHKSDTLSEDGDIEGLPAQASRNALYMEPAQDFSAVPLASMMQMQMQLGVTQLAPMALAVTDDVDKLADGFDTNIETEQIEGRFGDPTKSTVCAKFSMENGKHFVAVQLGGAVSMRNVDSGRCIWHEQLGQGSNLIGVACIESDNEQNAVVAMCGWDGATYIFDDNHNLVRFKFEEPVTAFYACQLSSSTVTGEIKTETCLVYATFDNRIAIYSIDDILDNKDICADTAMDMMGPEMQRALLSYARECIMKDQDARIWKDSSEAEILAAVVKAIDWNKSPLGFVK
eukprot:Stramenopile-MAST_4_protein_691